MTVGVLTLSLLRFGENNIKRQDMFVSVPCRNTVSAGRLTFQTLRKKNTDSVVNRETKTG